MVIKIANMPSNMRQCLVQNWHGNPIQRRRNSRAGC